MLKTLALKLGMKLRATVYEIRTANPTVMAKDSKNLPTIPLMNDTGTKTARSIAEIAKIVKAISFVPSNAASNLPMPASIFL